MWGVILGITERIMNGKVKKNGEWNDDGLYAVQRGVEGCPAGAFLWKGAGVL